jgi:sugar lactone lactonase YvrE
MIARRDAKRSLFLGAALNACLVLTALHAQAAPAAVTLPGARAFPESMTSTADGTLYVGSLASGGIMRVAPGASEAQPWIAPGAYDTRSIFGLLADEKRNTLWACSNDVSALGVPGPSSVKGSFLKAFDLKTGALRASVALPHAPSLCNDIAIGPDGSAYVTNSRQPEILRLRPGARTFEIWLTDPLFAPPEKGAGLDGIAFSHDGTLYVDTYTTAQFFRVEVQDGVAGKVSELHPSQKLVLADALRPLDDGRFLLVEGGGRLDRVAIDGDTPKIETLKSGLLTPTGATVVGDTAWVAEGQLSVLFDPKLKGDGAKLPFHLYSVSLSKN